MKALHHLLFCLALLAAPTLLSAQRNYAEALQQGQAASQKGDYETALKKFRAAQAFDPSKRAEVDKEIDAAFGGMRRQRDEALKAKDRAEKAEKLAKDLVRQVEAEKQKAQTVLDKIYFYKERFGLAYDKYFDRYGFIDKALSERIPFRYDEALPFDYTGYAKVKQGGIYYLIDTLGAQYSLATEVGDLDSTITLLDLRQRDLTEIPAAVFENPQLKVLLLSNNQLSNLPPEIGKLINLQSLYLADNQLTSLPAEIGKLTKLQNLVLSGNQLASLPAEIGKLANLQNLVVSENQLASLSAQIGNLTNLHELNLSSNLLFSLPTEIGNLTSLQALYLGKNQLANLPAEIGKLTNLQLLYLQVNQLSALPGETRKLTNLHELNLSSNLLFSLPVAIENLTNLQYLNLGGNQLTSLPTGIGKLTKLRVLHLENNQMTEMPMEIRKLTNLNYLELTQNPFSAASIEHLRKNMSHCEIGWNAPPIPEELAEQYVDERTQYAKAATEAEAELQTDTSSNVKSSAAMTYNSLAWYQLLTGQFSEAEQSVRRGLELDSTNLYLHSNLPSALLMQGKITEAQALYLEWRDKYVGVLSFATYKVGFLADFKAFEEAGIIPPERVKDVAAIKKLLSE